MADLAVLLPVRLETRFKNGDLWIRVAPDEPWFVRDDPRVSDAELDALNRYAAAPRDSAADGVPPAFRALATQVGAPRAAALHRRFIIIAAADGSFSVRTPGPSEKRNGPAFSRIADFPAELVVWLQNGDAAPRDVLHLTVNRGRLLADFADPDVAGDARWWQDWNEAVAVGLAGIVPAASLGGTIDALYVTGLGDGDPAAHFSAIAADGRIGLLEPGTPTNSVDGADAAPLATDAGTWWRLLQTSPGDTDRDVSLALTGDASRLGNMPGGDRPQRTPASTLVTAMWPALWGFAAGQVFDVARGSAPAQWAARALFPEGAYPPVRIGPQPYGLLSVTAWQAWQPADNDPAIEAPLIAALIHLRDGHVRVSRARGTAATQTTEGLLDLLSDTPTSSRFRYRLTWPLELWWLGLVSAGGTDAWRPFAQAWSTQYRLADDLNLSPHRRYGARGISSRVGLPLVVPLGSPPGDVPELLKTLAAAALSNPSAFSNTGTLETSILNLTSGSSLLLRLATRSLQLSIADVQRAHDNVTTFDPEPISRNARQEGRLEQLIRQVSPVDTSNPPGGAKGLIDCANAVGSLGTIPVPALERMLAAAIDCANHRIDAWLVAPVQRRFDDLAARADTTRRLGAYGWVDGLAPGAPGPTSAGVLHAPSPPAALAAAVLRNRAVSDNGGRWAMNITSRSARVADRLAQHVRIGAHISEALGREVERVVGSTELIEQLRRDFPVRTEHAGRRTCDGLRVLAAQPFPVPTSADQNAALQELRDGLDAYGDLLVAEAVANLAEGRADAAGAVMQSAAGFSRPPELSLLRTPREGRAVSTSVLIAITHVADQALPAGDADRSLVRPAATLDPSVSAFLVTEAGAASSWDFNVSLTAGATAAQQRIVRLTDLGLEPADALSLTRTRLEQMAVARAAELAGLDVAGFSGVVTGGTAGTRYEQSVQLIGLIGRNPPDSRALSESASTPGGIDAAIDPQILARYAAVRDVCAALVRALHAQIALLTPDGEIDTADPVKLQQLAHACAAWGVAPDPPPRTSDATGPSATPAARWRHRLIDGVVMGVLALEKRLTDSPDAVAAGQLSRDEFLAACAALVSPTGQIAITRPIAASTLPSLTAVTGARDLDSSWLTVVAAVRPAVARLEAHQLIAPAPLRPFANRPADPWQADSTDVRRLIAMYAARPLDLSAMTPGTIVATALVDVFSEVIPSADIFTGAAFGFDAPAARAQQAILLAVSPDVTKTIDAAALAQILVETRELAHARMARPVDLDSQFWGLAPTALLPASGAIATPLARAE